MLSKINFFICGITVVVGIVLRTLMLTFTIDRNNGFIKNEYMTLAIAIIALLVVSAALIFFVSFYNKQKFKLVFKYNFLIFGVAEVLMAVAVINEAFFSPLLSYATSFQSIIHKVMALLTAFSFAYTVYCKVTKCEYPKIITIAPIAFFISRVIIVFSEFASLATVSDTIIETAAMCLALITLLNYSKFSCEIPIKNMRLCKAVAALCSFVCAVGSVPRIICQILDPKNFQYFSNTPVLTIFAASLFAAAFALKCEE